MTKNEANTEALATTVTPAQWVIYHMPGGTDVPALVVSVAGDGTPNIVPFTDTGQSAPEGTNAGQWSAIV